MAQGQFLMQEHCRAPRVGRHEQRRGSRGIFGIDVGATMDQHGDRDRRSTLDGEMQGRVQRHGLPDVDVHWRRDFGVQNQGEGFDAVVLHLEPGGTGKELEEGVVAVPVALVHFRAAAE